MPFFCALFSADKQRIHKDHYCQPGGNFNCKTGPILPKNNILGVDKKRACNNEYSAYKEHAARGMSVSVNEIFI